MSSRTRPQDEVFGVDDFVGGTDAAATSSKPVVKPNQQFGLCHTENVKNQPKPWPMCLSGNPNCNMISLENRKYKQGGQNKGSDEMWTYDAQGRIKSVKWGKYITWKENVRLYLSNDAVKTVAYQNQNNR